MAKKTIPPALREAAKATQFKPGQGGRPKGSRDKLGKAFIEALYSDFNDHGASAITTVRETEPGTYMRVVASILPKELEFKRPLADLTDAELANAIDLIRAAIAAPAGDVGSGTAEASLGKQTGKLPPLH